MTQAQAAAFIRQQTRTNSTTLTDTEIVVLGRVVTNRMTQNIKKVDEDILLLSDTQGLVASTTSANRVYTFTSDISNRVKAVEAMFDGTNWIKLLPKDFREHDDSTDETGITNNYSNIEGEAYYSMYNKKLFIWSGTIAVVASGLKVWYPGRLGTITDMTGVTEMDVDISATELGLPEALHELWCTKIIILWKGSREKPIPLTESEKSYKDDLTEAIDSLKHGLLERDVIGTLPSAVNRGNDGFDY